MDTKTFNAIKNLTQINDHGEAYLLAAKALGNMELAHIFSKINKQHVIAGELSYDLYEQRTNAYRALMAFAKRQMSEEEYKKFYMLF